MHMEKEKKVSCLDLPFSPSVQRLLSSFGDLSLLAGAFIIDPREKKKVFPELLSVCFSSTPSPRQQRFKTSEIQLLFFLLVYTRLAPWIQNKVYPQLQLTTPFIIMRVMAIINPFNDNNHTNNNHIVITIYAILRRAMSIGNRYLHFCKREGGRVFIFCVDTLTHARTHTHAHTVHTNAVTPQS